ncbi:MAG: DUF3857 domain-containing protein [Fulvivirga sp.]|nr:DUF3857 domain-containing protein [Fulvivirga sp.]
MKKILILSLLFLVVIKITTAQDLEELKSNFPHDNAVYTKLYMDIDVSVDDNSIKLVLNNHQEITHLNEHSNVHAKDKIYYSSFSQVEDIEAYTLSPYKKRFKKYPVADFKTTYDKNSSVFYDDTKVINFIFPAVTTGSTTVLSYTEEIKEPRFTPTFFFQNSLPIVDGRLTITVDEEIELKFFEYNFFEGLERTREVDKNRIKYSYNINNTEAFRYESNAPNIKYYAPHVYFTITAYTNKSGEKVELLSSEEALFNWYRTFIDGLATAESEALESIVAEITSDLESDLEKVKAIFYWVQDNIKYVAFEDGMRGLIPHNGDYVCEKRFGDCKDMASILINMMHMAGIKSYFTWVGTRDIPYSYTESPSPKVDNHMIATYISKDSTYYYLDATSQYSPFELPSSMIQGKEVLIGKEEGPEIRKVPVISKETNIMSDTLTIELKDGVVYGKGSVNLTGFARVFNSYRLNTKTNKGIEDYLNVLLAKGNNKFTLTFFEVENLGNLDAPIQINYEFEIPDYYKEIGNEIYINAHLDKSFADDIIDEDRQLPLENEYHYTNKIITRIQLPEGYQISYLPENNANESDVFGYSIQYNPQEKHIDVEKSFYLNYLILEEDKFEQWNQPINHLSNALRETIILRKADSK